MHYFIPMLYFLQKKNVTYTIKLGSNLFCIFMLRILTNMEEWPLQGSPSHMYNQWENKLSETGMKLVWICLYFKQDSESAFHFYVTWLQLPGIISVQQRLPYLNKWNLNYSKRIWFILYPALRNTIEETKTSPS